MLSRNNVERTTNYNNNMVPNPEINEIGRRDVIKYETSSLKR